MLTFILRRLLLALLVSITVLTFAFALTRLSGDLAISIAGPQATQACRKRNVVLPAFAPTPNRSNSNWPVADDPPIGIAAVVPSRDCRMLSSETPSGP